MEKKMIESYIIDFLSIKYDCSKDIFTKDGLNIIKNKTNNIKMLLYKNLILVSTREDKYDLVYNNLKNKSTYEIFEFPYVYGQSIYYVPNVNKDDDVLIKTTMAGICNTDSGLLIGEFVFGITHSLEVALI